MFPANPTRGKSTIFKDFPNFPNYSRKMMFIKMPSSTNILLMTNPAILVVIPGHYHEALLRGPSSLRKGDGGVLSSLFYFPQLYDGGHLDGVDLGIARVTPCSICFCYHIDGPSFTLRGTRVVWV